MQQHTYHIHVEGQVQGVGFRPFVYKLARGMGLLGWVNNTVDGVHVVFNAEAAAALAFYQALVERAPHLARITAHHMWETEARSFDDFRIVHSDGAGTPNLLLSPDFALCPACREELSDPDDRRYGYSFITCTLCGPRYSIVEGLPYDRERTTMKRYPMCSACRREYEEPQDRRYYSQTNSCGECGVRLEGPEGTATVEQAVEALRSGAIVAVKGIGGYLLFGDATDAALVERMRRRKGRPSKPFALMYPDLEILRGDVFLRPEEEEALLGPQAPIVLLLLRAAPSSGIAAPHIAPGLQQVGAMLPYAPLFEQLLRALGRPLVATSANVSRAPVIFEEQRAKRELPLLADLILSNDRPIATPQDDSVLRFTTHTRQPIVIRRARGMAPTFLQPDLDLPAYSALAMGASMKSTFTLLHARQTYISQYLGDLDNFDTQQNYRHTLNHLLDLLRVEPEVVLVDGHPDYFSSRLGEQLAEGWGVPLGKVQHHRAHFAAVLAEHDLLRVEEPVLGFVWDGTGLGDDGQIWGGECFLYEKRRFRRVGHQAYFDFILGDKMPREPRISALAITGTAAGWLRPKFSAEEWRVYRRLLEGGAPLRSSSVGRLFDAVASLLNVMDRASYEGEAAMRLEQLALRYFRSHGLDSARPFAVASLMEGAHWDGRRLLGQAAAALQSGAPPDQIAARFHRTLAEIVRRTIRTLEVKRACFSGGVFQNEVLVDLIRRLSGKEAILYFHRQLSPNDENVSLGQVACQLSGEPPAAPESGAVIPLRPGDEK